MEMDRKTVLIEKYNLKGSPNLGLIAATFGFFVGFAAVALFGGTAKELKVTMGLSATAMGFLVAFPQLSGSLLRIPFGAWVDKVGGKTPLIVLLCLSIVGMGGLTIVLWQLYPDKLTMSHFPLILFFALLSGCGVATFSVGIPQTSYWFPQKKQGIALATYGGLGNTAPGLFVLIIVFVIAGGLSLAASYFCWFIFLIVGLTVYAIIAHDAYYFQIAKKKLGILIRVEKFGDINAYFFSLIKRGVHREEAISVAKEMGQELIPTGKLVEALKTSAKLWRNWMLVLLYFTSFGGFLALIAWFPSYWRLFHDFAPVKAGVLGGAGFGLLAAFIRVWGGQLSDKYGGENISIISFALLGVGATILMFSTVFIPCFIGELLIASGMGIANAAVFKMVPKYVPEAVGGAAGWVGGLGAFGGFAVPPILGLFADKMGNVGYARGFVVYVVLAIMCVGISILLKAKPPEGK